LGELEAMPEVALPMLVVKASKETTPNIFAYLKQKEYWRSYFEYPKHIADAAQWMVFDVFGSSMLGAVPVGGVFRGAGAAKAEKVIVIGEGMGAVKTTAKTLQAQGINAKWYQAWSKNFPTNRLMTPTEFSAAQARNARWLNSKINQGYKIYDIGIDATRTIRSPFYQLERNILQQRGYPTTVIPR
jgi:hypothetical protein